MTKQVETKAINTPVQVHEERRIEPIFKKKENGEDILVGFSIDGHNIALALTLPEDENYLLTTALKELTGHKDIFPAMGFLLNTADSLRMVDFTTALQYLISFLQEMKPADAIEAKLLAQFLLLDNSAGKLIYNAKNSETLIHSEFNYKHGMKAMNLAQQVIQSLTKYKAKGTQQINVVHMEGDSKAIFTGGRG